MAQFPCSRCGKRYHGPQQTAYPAIIVGPDAIRTKMRLCPPDFLELSEWCVEHLEEAIDELAVVETCALCSVDEPQAAVFVTLYAMGKDREDFLGRVCRDCAPKTAVAFFGEKKGVQPT